MDHIIRNRWYFADFSSSILNTFEHIAQTHLMNFSADLAVQPSIQATETSLEKVERSDTSLSSNSTESSTQPYNNTSSTTSINNNAYCKR